MKLNQKGLIYLAGLGQKDHVSIHKKAFVSYDPTRVRVGQIIRVIKDSGYDVSSEKVTLKIREMTCASCVRKVEDALKGSPGVIWAEVNLGSESAVIEYLSSMTDLKSLKTSPLKTRKPPSERSLTSLLISLSSWG